MSEPTTLDLDAIQARNPYPYADLRIMLDEIARLRAENAGLREPPLDLAAIRAVLTAEAEWLWTVHANSADKGYSDDLCAGFRSAAGWVGFHADHPELVGVDVAAEVGQP